MATTRIKGYTFTISEPFHPGTVITRGEAQALNDLRLENIANNLRKLVADACAVLEPGQLLSEVKLAELQAAITKYDHGYTFTERHAPRPRLGDIEAEVQALALELVEAAVRRSELEVDGVELQRLVELKAQEPEVQAAARERVAAKRRAISGGLDTL